METLAYFMLVLSFSVSPGSDTFSGPKIYSFPSKETCDAAVAEVQSMKNGDDIVHAQCHPVNEPLVFCYKDTKRDLCYTCTVAGCKSENPNRFN